ncbi:zinc finger protein CONSTANS-LIKE 6 [Nicotiana tabacum]|uniref:Zinc finger protein CONSTANS-LIKE 6 n=1 Tax=Nicotiana tabacum TaxID=4097 RepID=A0A1S4ANL5_TOBAC|nr:PREDICTED: zinc finger protein CONSTANS-LIKE 6-like [Nicotiana tabacum]
MMTSERKTANAIGGKTARACDSCLSKRARWFCPADDAFLCQSCDVSVHSANQLASRHERVRLETSSNKSTDTKFVDQTASQPSWHQGFTRKARTPRNGKNKSTQIGQRKKDEENMVPEMGSEENSPDDENEEQLLYRVPVFDPFEAELCTVPNEVVDETTTINDLDILLNSEDACDDLGIPKFLSSEIELAEFAADVESLLGEEFRVVAEEEDEEQSRLINGVVEDNKAIKIEVEDEEMRAVVACHLDPELDMAREALNWDFEYEETVEQKVNMAAATEFVPSAECGGSKADAKRRMLLRLNYEEVISAWPNQSSPWTNGIRPHFNPDDCWPDFLETCIGEGGHQPYGGGNVRGGDGGREARVSRYREKRRTRLFSKKIRYEVRKLNAEKRPRLKGRFVKRTTSFSAPGFPYLMNKR